jgi:hypothetical protein
MRRCDAAADEGDQVQPPESTVPRHGVGPRQRIPAARAWRWLRERAGRRHARELEESDTTPPTRRAEVVLFAIPFLVMDALTFAVYYLSH